MECPQSSCVYTPTAFSYKLMPSRFTRDTIIATYRVHCRIQCLGSFLLVSTTETISSSHLPDVLISECTHPTRFRTSGCRHVSFTRDVPPSPHTGSIATDRVLAGFFWTKLLGLIITSTAAIATMQPARIMHPKVFRLSCSHLCCGVPARPSLHVDICHCNAMPEKSGALQQAKPDRPLLD